MTNKPGRNDPCPCGSGRKFKHCCIDKTESQASALKSRSGDDVFNRYKEISVSLNRKGAQSSSTAKRRDRSSGTTEKAHTLREKAGKREFRTEKVLKKFLAENSAEINNAPNKDFLGLSHAQLHRIILEGFVETGGIMAMNFDISPELLESVPALERCRYLLREIAAEEKGIKATQNGNLPRVMIQRFYDRFIKEHDIQSAPPIREDELKEIQRARFFLADAGYIILRHGYYVPTEKGRAALSVDDPAGIYREIFLYVSREYNWLFGTRYPDVMGILQQSLIFCLHVIRKRAKNFVLGETLALQFRKAFPSLSDEMGPEYGDIFLRIGFCHIFCDEYAAYLGILEKEKGSGSYFSREFRFKTTPLFNKLFVWAT